MSAIQEFIDFYKNKLEGKMARLEDLSKDYNKCLGQIDEIECFIEDLEFELRKESEDK